MDGVTFLDENAENEFNAVQLKPSVSNNGSQVSDSVAVKQELLDQDVILEFDPELIELKQILTKPHHSGTHSNLVPTSLNGVPLVDDGLETENKENWHKPNYMLIRAPDNLQDDLFIESLPSLKLKPSTLKAVNKATSNLDGVKLPSLNMSDYFKPISRTPLQTVEQVITVPVVYNELQVDDNANIKKSHKRKQEFDFHQEDRVEFYR